MKKIIGLVLASMMLVLALTACQGTPNDTPTDNPTTNPPSSQATNPPSTQPTVNDAPITVISREDGSGTRGAFVELFGIEEKDADGNKIDKTIDIAEITNSTSVMMTSVAGDPNSIGYIWLKWATPTSYSPCRRISVPRITSQGGLDNAGRF